MARPRKQTVDYFPHDTDASINSRTLAILENKFGNDGYIFWYKLLELLGRTDGHAYNFEDDGLEYLSAQTKIKDTGTLLMMLETLAKRGTIDKELYRQKIIWCQNFVDGIAEAYRSRKAPLPQKPVSNTHNPIASTDNPVSPPGNPQTILNYTKLKETKGNNNKSSSLNIYKIYENEIGTLTPLIENELKLALKEFSPAKIQEAIKEAVKQNHRKWSYINGILENWKTGRGKNDPDPNKYIKGKYGHLVQR